MEVSVLGSGGGPGAMIQAAKPCDGQSPARPTPSTTPGITGPGCSPPRAARPQPRPGVQSTPGNTAAAAARGAHITVMPGVITTPLRARVTADHTHTH